MQPSKLFSKISTQIQDIRFMPNDDFHWDPEHKIVWFIEEMLETDQGRLLLAHEVGHACLGHTEFTNDIDLLRKEVQAWEEARSITAKCSIEFSEDLAEQCLDTYRSWVDKRSTCPNCQQTGYQTNLAYHCLNCNHHWRVSAKQTTRVCRLATTPY